MTSGVARAARSIRRCPTVPVLLLAVAMPLHAEVRFGTLSTVSPSVLHENMLPALDFLGRVLGEQVVLVVGRNYDDTMHKLSSGELDIGFIGPVPYHAIRGQVDLLARVEAAPDSPFRTVVVVRHDSPLHALQDLRGRSFAFGSPRSTLSFYVPAEMLMREGVFDQLSGYGLLNRHDRVAKNVIIGKYDAGAVKQSVYHRYADFLRPLTVSDAFQDFVMVCRKGFPDEKKHRLRDALLGLKDPRVLQGFKSGAVGFRTVLEEDFNNLGGIIGRVDSRLNP